MKSSTPFLLSWTVSWACAFATPDFDNNLFTELARDVSGDHDFHLSQEYGKVPLLSPYLPVANSSKSFWLDTPGANPLANTGSTGELTQDADVCIIGSGITGVSAAWHLSNNFGGNVKLSPSVAILEAREFCSGATGRNGGHLAANVFYSFIARETFHNTSEAIKMYLLERRTVDELLSFIHERGLQDRVDLVEGGHVSFIKTLDEEAAVRRDYEAAKSAGWISEADTDVRWITNEELIKDYGLSPALNYTGVALAARNLWPCKVVTELFNNAQEHGNVVLHTNTPVLSVIPAPYLDQGTQQPLQEPTERRRWLLTTPRGNVQCGYVVHATNGYAGHLLPFLRGPVNTPLAQRGSQAAPLPVDVPEFPIPPPRRTQPTVSATEEPDLHERAITQPAIVPTRGQVGAVRASVNASGLAWRNAWGSSGGWEYWFPRLQDANGDTNPLVILGGGRQHAGGRLEVNVVDDSGLNPRVSEALHAFLPSTFPDQFDASVEWEMEWTGIMAYTKSGDPYVGAVGPLVHHLDEYHEGQYIAAGYSGHGMPRAYSCGEAVAGMITAKIRGEEWKAPDWLPESYLTTSHSTPYIRPQEGLML